MLPATPTRLSMTTGCFHASDSFCPSVRPMMSDVPPGANGTTMRIGLAGYSWAGAATGASAKTSANAAVKFLMGYSSDGYTGPGPAVFSQVSLAQGAAEA